MINPINQLNQKYQWRNHFFIFILLPPFLLYLLLIFYLSIFFFFFFFFFFVASVNLWFSCWYQRPYWAVVLWERFLLPIKILGWSGALVFWFVKKYEYNHNCKFTNKNICTSFYIEYVLTIYTYIYIYIYITRTNIYIYILHVYIYIYIYIYVRVIPLPKRTPNF